MKRKKIPFSSGLVVEQGRNLPVYVRSPTRGPEHFSGLSRGKLYSLDELGLIRSVSVVEPGKSRGCRLFDLSSILKYIERCSETGTGKTEGTKTK